MRGLIIDHARSRSAQKRGGGFELTSFSTDIADQAVDEGRLTAISDAVDALSRNDAALAEVVDLKFFCGFTFSEIGAMRGVSERTVQRQWDKARIYLHRSLRDDAATL
jgi:DNA-directed RNA polymerase specialized sigma24 family protein